MYPISDILDEPVNDTVASEIAHFTNLSHIWWGAKTVAGQKRYDNKLTLFQQNCNVRSGARILEVGCGDGEFTKRLSQMKTRNVTITATDITPRVVTRARKHIKNPKVTFQIDNLENMRFKRRSFDIVCGISILHHVTLQKSLHEIYRVLKNGGKIFFTEPNLLNPNIYLGLHIPILRRKMEFSKHERAFIRWQLQKELLKAGFIHVEVKNYDFLHPLIPARYIHHAERIGHIAEKLPLIKEISGSLLI